MFLIAIDFDHTYIKKWCYAGLFLNECKSCEINNQIFFQCNTFVFENKRRTGYDINIAK